MPAGDFTRSFVGGLLITYAASVAPGSLRKSHLSASTASSRSGATNATNATFHGSLTESDGVALTPLLEYPIGDNEEPWVALEQGHLSAQANGKLSGASAATTKNAAVPSSFAESGSMRVPFSPLLEFPIGDNEEPWVALEQTRLSHLGAVSIMEESEHKYKELKEPLFRLSVLHMVSALILAVSSITYCIFSVFGLPVRSSSLSSLLGSQQTSTESESSKLAASSLSAKTIALSVCAVYVVVSVGIDVAIKLQASGDKSVNGGYTFNPKCAVCATEAMKLVLSTGLYSYSCGFSMPDNYSAEDIKWLLVPAVLYALNNLLVFKALGVNDAASFGIFRDTTIIWTAAIRWSVFKTPLGRIRLAGIAIIMVGLFLNRLSSVVGAKNSFSFMFLWVVVMTLTNATASVANEYAVKRNKDLDINFQNGVIYAAGITFLCVLMLLTEPHLLLPSEFFKGFTYSALLLVTIQGGQGLLVSRLLKYADAMTKTVATCLRGPTLVFVAACIVANSGSTVTALCCAAIVATGCFVFLSQGPLH